MNREQKAAVIEEVAAEIRESEAVFAIDYRGISVRQAGDLRVRLGDVGASFRVVKNTLTERAADQAGTAELKQYLEGPTAFAFVRGDAATAAKALAAFRRETRLLEYKGGLIGDRTLTAEDIDTISRLPAREALQAQFVGVLASPVTGLVRGLAGLVSGLATALDQIQEQGLIGDATTAADTPESASSADDAGSGDGDGGGGGGEDTASDEGVEPGATESSDAGTEAEPVAPGDPVSEAAAAEEESTDEESGS
ncbi:MAG: 50S ribosomal protein L10 [Thermoleophilaceae bacterium]|nr:50S ribosomal protein L10 [Thermoleophilaceae bacterium]